MQEDDKKWVYSVFAGVFREVMEMGIEENPAKYEEDCDWEKEYIDRLARQCATRFYRAVWGLGLNDRNKSDFTVGKIKGNDV